MPRKKKVEEKIEFKPEAFMSMTDAVLDRYLCKMFGPKSEPILSCLKEFGITGMRLLAFMSRLGELQREYDEEHLGEKVDELLEEE